MFLHLGADTIIPLKEIIMISDRKGKTGGVNNDFLQLMREEGMIVDVSAGKHKSFVITDNKVYLSAISSFTLKRRASHAIVDVED